MPCLLPLLALLLLLSVDPTVAKVVSSMSDCDQYFLDLTPPQIPGILEGGNILDRNRYKPICQTFNNMKTFVTLYDTTHKIPVFSAYKYIGRLNISRPGAKWRTEEELGNANGKTKPQACNTDYANQDQFDRGHLLPSSYGFNETDKKSTFTLTNVVPQVKEFNKGRWNFMESCVQCVLDKYCINSKNKTEGFVVIGAQPGDKFLKEKINIPSMLWSAFCCYSRIQEKWLAGAHWDENIKHGNKYLQTKTLDELHRELGAGFKAFPGTVCPLAATPTRLYSNLKATCNCPPPISTTSAPTTTSTPPVSRSVSLLTPSVPPLILSVPPLVFYLYF